MPDELTIGQVIDLQRRAKVDGLESLSPAEQQIVAMASESAARFLAPYRPLFHRMAEEAVQVESVIGCDPADAVEKYGARYGKLTMPEMIQQGRRGLRGRRALDAALVARVRSAVRGSCPERRRVHHGGHHPRAHRRTSRIRARTPGRGSDDPPHPDVDHRCGVLE